MFMRSADGERNQSERWRDRGMKRTRSFVDRNAVPAHWIVSQFARDCREQRIGGSERSGRESVSAAAVKARQTRPAKAPTQSCLITTLWAFASRRKAICRAAVVTRIMPSVCGMGSTSSRTYSFRWQDHACCRLASSHRSGDDAQSQKWLWI